MPANKKPSIVIFLAIAAVGLAAFFVFMAEENSEEQKITYTPNEEMVKRASEIVNVSVYPDFPFTYDYMTEGVTQHLDREYTYDVIPYQLKGGLLFQGIHRPEKGTTVSIELLKPATLYFFFHDETDGGYTRIFENLPRWRRLVTAPQYDIHNGKHGLQMTMFALEAEPGLIEIPPTTKDRACFSFVIQSVFGNLAEPDS